LTPGKATRIDFFVPTRKPDGRKNTQKRRASSSLSFCAQTSTLLHPPSWNPGARRPPDRSVSRSASLGKKSQFFLLLGGPLIDAPLNSAAGSASGSDAIRFFCQGADFHERGEVLGPNPILAASRDYGSRCWREALIFSSLLPLVVLLSWFSSLVGAGELSLKIWPSFAASAQG
jgi:hypothetical protein